MTKNEVTEMEANDDEILPSHWLDELTNDQKIRIELLLEEMITAGTSRQATRNMIKRARDKEIRFASQLPCTPEEVNYLLTEAQFDSDKGEITIAGSDWILMRGGTLRALIKRAIGLLGTRGMQVLFEAGRHSGKEFARAILKEGMPLEELPSWLTAFFTRSGWGKIETHVDFINKQAVVEIYNCVTARGHLKESSYHFIRGYIAGIGEVLFKSPTECSETKCASKGDASCFFRVQRKTRDTSSQLGETEQLKERVSYEHPNSDRY
jgi:predicted hydrocarbon binding protein